MKQKQTRKKRHWGWVLIWLLLGAWLAGLYARFVEPELLIVRRLTLPAQNLKDDCIYGDFNQVTVEEVEKLMSGDTSGRVSR